MKNNGVKISAVISHFCSSQREFAERLKVSSAVVSNWKKRGVLSAETLASIFQAFPNLNPAFFFDDNAPIEKSNSAFSVQSGHDSTLSNSGNSSTNNFFGPTPDFNGLDGERQEKSDVMANAVLDKILDMLQKQNESIENRLISLESQMQERNALHGQLLKMLAEKDRQMGEKDKQMADKDRQIVEYIKSLKK